MKLTDKSIADLTLPADTSDRVIFDQDLPGFGLRIRASGARSWIVQYAVHGRTKRVTLGSTKVFDAHAARAAAKDVMAKVRLGGDPAKEKNERREEATRDTLGSLVAPFLARQQKRLKPRSYYETVRHITKHALPLHHQPIKAIDRRMVAQLLERLEANNGPGASNRVRTSLSAMFTWAVKAGHIEFNVVCNTNKAIENGPRERVLTDIELGAIWRALEDDDHGAVMKLLILTGARREEIAGLRWAELRLDEAVIRLPKERTKNSRAHDIPLAPQALAMLKARRRNGSELVFEQGSYSRGKHALDQRLGGAIAHWTPHDFRRTISTRLHGVPFSVQPHVIEALLGHVDGHRRGVAGVYNHQLYVPERTVALVAWGEHVERIAAGAAVIDLPRKAA